MNSVGCAEDRARYNQALREALQPVVHQMCADCQRRAETNPLRVLDCKHPEDQPIIEKLPKIGQYLDEPCREHFAAVRAMLDAVAYRITSMSTWCVASTTTRARRSSSRTAAWARRARCLAAAATMDCRRSLDGPKAPGIGFAIGEDRLIMALQAQGEQPAAQLHGFVAPLGVGMNSHALKLARELRRAA